MAACPSCFEPVIAPYTVGMSVQSGVSLFTSWLPGSRESGGEKDQCPTIALMHTICDLLLIGPTS